jgi:tRNA(fMet)-specific endonuclease VapC
MSGHTEVHHALQQAEEVYLCPIILGELLAGFARGKHRKRNEKELEQFILSPRVLIVNLDQETAERYALILNTLWKAGTPIPTNDQWIAASAMQHGLRLLTTDAHFQKVAQVIVDYFPAQ